MATFELSNEQKAKMEDYKQKWRHIAFELEGMNKDAVKDCVREIYEVNGHKPPDTVLFFDSPYACAAFIREQMGVPSGADLPYEFRDAIIYGTTDAYWLGFHDFAIIEVLPDVIKGASQSDRAELEKYQRTHDPYIRAAEAGSGWVFTLTDAILICQPPNAVRFDDDDNLHAVRQLAISFPDGNGQAYWRGLAVPNNWVLNPAETSAADVLGTRNADIRAAGCEIIGWNKILDDLGGEVLDVDPDPQIGSLVSVTLPEADMPTLFLKALDPSKGTDIAVPVGSDCATALQAQAQSYGVSEQIIKAKVVRT